MSLWWASAALLSLVTFAVHTFVGGPVVAGPLLADRNLPIASKWLNYYCWHNTTIVLLFMAAAFAWSARWPDRWEPAAGMSLLATALAIWSAACAMKGRINPFRFPSTSLFTGIAVLGLCGWITSH